MPIYRKMRPHERKGPGDFGLNARSLMIPRAKAFRAAFAFGVKRCRPSEPRHTFVDMRDFGRLRPKPPRTDVKAIPDPGLPGKFERSPRRSTKVSQISGIFLVIAGLPPE